jgi:hypothetical protein
MKKTVVFRVFISLLITFTLLTGPFSGMPGVSADHTPDPSSVTIAGSLQSELGCPGDWQPECALTFLTAEANDDVWQGVFSVPPGSWEYKAALNGTWDENYGLNAQPGGANIPLSLAADSSVKFFYDHKSHWITDNVNSVIASVPGSFQSELGCSADWAPDCLRSWLGPRRRWHFTSPPAPSTTLWEWWPQQGWMKMGLGGVLNGFIPSVGDNQTMTFHYDPVPISTSS